jgi:nucleoid-associated protein YgaU
MHSIERYGVIALLFLVVTVVAVLMWNGSEEETDPASRDTVSQAPALRAPATAHEAAPEPERPATFTTLESRPRALLRESFQPGAPPGDVIPERLLTAPRLPAAGGTAGREDALEEHALTPRSDARAGAASPPPRTLGGSVKTYEVQAGDTLGEIALAVLGTSKRWKELVDLNPGIDPEHLRVGARLRLPAEAALSASGGERAAEAAPTPTPGGTSAPAAGATYVVRAGDMLWTIAERELGDGNRWRDIARLNPAIDPDRLLTGQRLVLPADAGSASPPLVPRPRSISPASATSPASLVR